MINEPFVVTPFAVVAAAIEMFQIFEVFTAPLFDVGTAPMPAAPVSFEPAAVGQPFFPGAGAAGLAGVVRLAVFFAVPRPNLKPEDGISEETTCQARKSLFSAAEGAAFQAADKAAAAGVVILILALVPEVPGHGGNGADD
jgi:hypothetical protein